MVFAEQNLHLTKATDHGDTNISQGTVATLLSTVDHCVTRFRLSVEVKEF